MSRPAADGQGLLVGAVDLDVRPDAARRARRTLANRLAGHDGLNQERVDDCLFLVSEVVANVTEHADVEKCPFLRVVWIRHGDILRTEVYDPDPIIPSVGPVSLDAEDGRGLWLVAAMVDRWSAEPVPTSGDLWWCGGKVVWFAVRGVWVTRETSHRAGLQSPAGRGGVPVAKITTQMVQEWRAQLLGNGVSESMTAKAYRLLRAVLMTAADEDEIIASNPCRVKGAGDEKAGERPVLTVAQVFELADRMRDPRFRGLVLLATFAASTG